MLEENYVIKGYIQPNLVSEYNINRIDLYIKKSNMQVNDYLYISDNEIYNITYLHLKHIDESSINKKLGKKEVKKYYQLAINTFLN